MSSFKDKKAIFYFLMKGIKNESGQFLADNGAKFVLAYSRLKDSLKTLPDMILILASGLSSRNLKIFFHNISGLFDTFNAHESSYQTKIDFELKKTVLKWSSTRALSDLFTVDIIELGL